jgi:DNA-binding response OmpR family regulator
MFTIPCNRRILLVDEDLELRTVLGLVLAAEGFDVCEADNGEQAVSLFCRRPLALVITELKLGGNDSFEIIAEMYRELVCPRLIATARPGWLPADLCTRVAKGLGAQSVLMKPFSPLEFLSAVHGALGETNGHSFSPTIAFNASRPPLPATMRMTGTLRTAVPSANCTRVWRRWRRGIV